MSASSTTIDHSDLVLPKAQIVLLGLGPIGACILDILLRSDAGMIVAIDSRPVEVELLQGQAVYTPEDIGQPRVDVIEEYTKRTASKTNYMKIHEQITGPQQLAKYIAGSDFMICTSDDPPFRIREWVTTACLAENIPYLCVADGVIGPCCVPFQTACYGCYLGNLNERVEMLTSFATARAENNASVFHSSKSHNWFAPTTSGTSMILGSMAALEVLRYFSNMPPQTYDHILKTYPGPAQHGIFALEGVTRRVDCHYCSGARA